MNKLSEILQKYLKKYVSTRTIFAMDVVLSAFASFFAALLAEFLIGSGVFSITNTIVWTVTGAAAASVMILVFRTYRIIIRHTTLRQLARFACMAFGQALIIFTSFTIIYGYSNTALLAAFGDLLLTFAILVVIRAAMVIVYVTPSKPNWS